MLIGARFGTRDLNQAVKFYDPIAKLLGADRIAMEVPNAVFYKGPQGAMFIVGLPYEGDVTFGNGVQANFSATSRAVVDAVHAKALELGGKDEGAPGIRGPADRGAYGAYFRDLDGNKIAVFAFS